MLTLLDRSFRASWAAISEEITINRADKNDLESSYERLVQCFLCEVDNFPLYQCYQQPVLDVRWKRCQENRRYDTSSTREISLTSVKACTECLLSEAQKEPRTFPKITLKFLQKTYQSEITVLNRVIRKTWNVLNLSMAFFVLLHFLLHHTFVWTFVWSESVRGQLYCVERRVRLLGTTLTSEVEYCIPKSFCHWSCAPQDDVYDSVSRKQNTCGPFAPRWFEWTLEGLSFRCCFLHKHKINFPKPKTTSKIIILTHQLSQTVNKILVLEHKCPQFCLDENKILTPNDYLHRYFMILYNISNKCKRLHWKTNFFNKISRFNFCNHPTPNRSSKYIISMPWALSATNCPLQPMQLSLPYQTFLHKVCADMFSLKTPKKSNFHFQQPKNQ